MVRRAAEELYAAAFVAEGAMPALVAVRADVGRVFHGAPLQPQLSHPHPAPEYTEILRGPH
jgi:hypothetical protein